MRPDTVEIVSYPDADPNPTFSVWVRDEVEQLIGRAATSSPSPRPPQGQSRLASELDSHRKFAERGGCELDSSTMKTTLVIRAA